MTVDALPAGPDEADALDLSTLGVCFWVLRPRPERLVIHDGYRRIRLDVREGSLRAGPVRLRYLIEGLADLGHNLLTLRRLVALRRLGRFPASLFPAERRMGRWILMLRTIDALATGASHRDIAEGLFGSAAGRGNWRTQSDYARLRVQRLARSASALVEGGYLGLLGGRPPL